MKKLLIILIISLVSCNLKAQHHKKKAESLYRDTSYNEMYRDTIYGKVEYIDGRATIRGNGMVVKTTQTFLNGHILKSSNQLVFSDGIPQRYTLGYLKTNQGYLYIYENYLFIPN